MKKCMNCGKEFEYRASGYCSQKCYMEALKKQASNC